MVAEMMWKCQEQDDLTDLSRSLQYHRRTDCKRMRSEVDERIEVAIHGCDGGAMK